MLRHLHRRRKKILFYFYFVIVKQKIINGLLITTSPFWSVVPNKRSLSYSHAFLPGVLLTPTMMPLMFHVLHVALRTPFGLCTPTRQEILVGGSGVSKQKQVVEEEFIVFNDLFIYLQCVPRPTASDPLIQVRETCGCQPLSVFVHEPLLSNSNSPHQLSHNCQ